MDANRFQAVLFSNLIHEGNMNQKSYPWGIDCIWVATDSARNIAAFTTAGFGPIPTEIIELSKSPIEDVEEKLLSLPQISEVEMVVSQTRPDDFLSLAGRGLYVFDWSDVHRTKKNAISSYELIARPLNPLLTESLPAELYELYKVVQLKCIDFAYIKVLDIRSILPCCEPESIR
jgi:hypothetical protein